VHLPLIGAYKLAQTRQSDEVPAVHYLHAASQAWQVLLVSTH